MKRRYSEREVDESVSKVNSRLDALKGKLPTAEANALSEMMKIASDFADKAAEEMLDYGVAGDLAKPQSSHGGGPRGKK